MNADQHLALGQVLEVGLGRRAPDPDQPAAEPLTYVDAAVVVEHCGVAHICPIVVTDFYREDPQP